MSNLVENISLLSGVARNPSRLRAILYKTIAQVAKKPGVAIIVDNKQSIPVEFAEQAGLNCLFFTVNNVVQNNGLWVWKQYQQQKFQPYLLANSNVDYQLMPRVQAGFEGIGLFPETIKQRRFDEQYQSIKSVSWLHINEKNYSDIILGSKKRILKDQPIITITSVSLTVEHLSVLSEMLDYQIYDHTLNQLVEGFTCSNDIVLLPKNSSYITDIQSLMSFNHRVLERDFSIAKAIKTYYMSLVQSSNVGDNLLNNYLFQHYKRYNIVNLLTKGFYTPEFDGDNSWRWCGKTKDAEIILPLPASGQYHFNLGVYSLPENRANESVRIFANGINVFDDQISAGSNIEFDILTDVNSAPNGLVSLIISTLNRSSIEGNHYSFSLSHIDVHWHEDELL